MNHESDQFKRWIKKRFISELDIPSLSYKDIALWSIALHELADELIDTHLFTRFMDHQIVPFRRGGE